MMYKLIKSNYDKDITYLPVLAKCILLIWKNITFILRKHQQIFLKLVIFFVCFSLSFLNEISFIFFYLCRVPKTFHLYFNIERATKISFPSTKVIEINTKQTDNQRKCMSKGGRMAEWLKVALPKLVTFTLNIIFFFF